MARVGQFKALGSALGGYKKTLADVQSKDYAKRYADVRAQEQVSLYNEIGGTVANIIGIAQEKKALKKLQPLDKPDRPNVPIEPQSPDNLEGIDIVKGEEVDFSPDLSMEKLEMRESEGDFVEAPPKTVLEYNDPDRDLMGRGKSPAFGLDNLIGEYQNKNPNARTNFDENIKQKPINTQDTVYDRAKETVNEFKDLYNETISDDETFDLLLEDNNKAIIPSNNKFYGKLDSTQKQNLQAAGKSGGSFAQKVMMRESSGGVNTGDGIRAGSMFQFQEGQKYNVGAGDLPIPKGTLGDVKAETEYFMKYNKQITKDFSDPNPNRKDSGGQSIYDIAKRYGVSEESANYGAHQQGASGYKDIITAADSGNLSGGNNRISKMLNNVTPEQLKKLNSKYRKASGLTHQSLENSGQMKSFIKDWLGMQQESWDSMEGDFF